MQKINIAIDGPSGAGKSTVAKKLAKELNYTFINTGSVYRAIALYTIEHKLDYMNENIIKKHLFDIKITLDNKENIFLDQVNVSKKIREDKVSKVASVVAQYMSVRHYVVEFVQNITKTHKGYVMDGRDTTFRIMPNAEVKIFLTASVEERTKRRIEQNRELGYETDYNTVYAEVQERDYKDIHRVQDPLHKTKDAYLIDCDNLSIDQVIQAIIERVKLVTNE